MKKLVLLFAMLLSASMANAAVILQTNDTTLELYGNLDSGVLFGDNLGTNKKSAMILINSPQLTSKFGVKGAYELGDGVRAGFQFTHQILPGDGSNGLAASTGATNQAFNLAAFTWLEDPVWGKISLGRQNSVLYEGTKFLDTRWGTNFGSTLSFWCDSTMFGGSATSKTGMTSLTGSNQVSNAIRYDAPVFKDIKVSGMYVIGEVAGDIDASSKKILSVSYTGIDKLQVGVAGMVSESSAGLITARTIIYGANYRFLDDKATIAAGWIDLSNPSLADGSANKEFTLKDITGKYQVTPQLAVTGGWYELSNDNVTTDKATQLSLIADYSLSKSVGIYAGWAQIKNEGGMGMAPYGAGQFNLNSISTTYPSVIKSAGETQSAVMAGMIIRF